MLNIPKTSLEKRKTNKQTKSLGQGEWVNPSYSRVLRSEGLQFKVSPGKKL
jgi:hypothetical protein